MGRTRSQLRRLENEYLVPKAPAPALPSAAFPERPYTLDEWNHFTQTRILLERDGEAAAREWLHAHPRPQDVPAWLLAREAESRRLLTPHLPPIPDLSPSSRCDPPANAPLGEP